MSSPEFRFFDAEDIPDKPERLEVDDPLQIFDNAYAAVNLYSITEGRQLIHREDLTRAYWCITPPQVSEMSEDYGLDYFSSLTELLNDETEESKLLPAEEIALRIRKYALFAQDSLNKIIHKEPVDPIAMEFVQTFLYMFKQQVTKGTIVPRIN